MNKKRIWFLTAVSVLLLGLSGCPSETAGSQTSVGTTQTTNGNGGQTPPTVPNDGNTKITSLQAVINAADVGAEIDLSQYASIENFDYKATVNKAVTLTNGNDLGGAALTVVSDGVKLNGIKNASVTTNSSMKISGSSLSSLSIASAGSSTPSANQIVSRGETVRSAQPPVVEVDNTTVTEDVSVGIANAYLTVEKFTASTHVSLDAANVQLTISDKATNIKEIKTDKICQVILEDGTSDTIPCSLDKISVTGSGELKQIDMRAAGSMKLLALTPMSGLTTVAKQGEPIDFSTIVLLGTYQADDGITLFRASGLSESLTETFSKLERDFKISIDNQTAYHNGSAVSTFDWTSLTAGKNTAVIDSDYETKDSTYTPYQFDIVIIGAAENETEIVLPTFELTGIEIMAANVKTQYKAGEPLNLTGLLVTGTYTATVGDITYQSIVTDYTLTPPNGTILTTNDKEVTVSVGTFTRTLPITVKSVLNVTFVIDAADEQNGTIVQTVLQGDKVAEQTPQNKQGYTFDGWYLKTGDSIADVTYDFGTIVSENITLVAKWAAKVYKVTLNLNYGGSSSTTIDATYDCKLSDITPPTRTGYEFQGYNAAIDGTGIWYYNINGVGGVWKIADNAVLYAHWTPKQYAVSLMDGDQECSSITAIYNQNLSVASNKIPTKPGYIFNGFWSALDGGVQYIDATGDGVKLWTASDDVSYDSTLKCYNLYARWTAVWTTDASGDFICGDKTYKKTALIPVMNNAIKINGSGTEGVFVNGRTVTLSPYAIGKYEVTQELYKAVTGNNPSHFTAANAPLDTSNGETTDDLRPVENVRWYDAVVFCNKLSLLMGKNRCYKLSDNTTYPETVTSIPTTNDTNWDNMSFNPEADGYRLPTECEWEFAARGGDPSDASWDLTYAGSNTIGEVAWYTTNSGSQTKEVGLKNPISDEFDVYDMSGNVWEWCWDNYNDAQIDSNTPVTGPTNNNSQDFKRRLRGGSWYNSQEGCTVFIRGDFAPYLRDNNRRGFRLVQNIPQDPSLPSNRIAANGNFVIDNIEYKKTALKKVMDNPVTVTGSGSEGVFVNGRNVTLSPYFIGKFEMTQEFYLAVMGENPSTFNETYALGNGEHSYLYRPVDHVSWYDVVVFCNKLSTLMGKTRCYKLKNESYPETVTIPSDTTSDVLDNMICDLTVSGYRLPTEAEWEFAARGGDPSDDAWNFKYAGSNTIDEVAWYYNNSGTSNVNGHPYEVGLKKANRLELYDMTGNQWEWCWDWYNQNVMINDDEYKINNVLTNPLGAKSGTERCGRGGSYGNRGTATVFYRADEYPDYPYRRTGGISFRLVQTVTE